MTTGQLNAEQGAELLRLARGAVIRAFEDQPLESTSEPWLLEPGATFVTLTMNDSLRGCIGSIEPLYPLGEDVQKNAISAAFRDPRFPPLERNEIDRIRFEVSRLTPMRKLAVESEEHLLASLRPDRDGLVIEWENHRATFLPSVWEQLPEPREFLEHLKRKAGLSTRFWSPDLECWIYETEKWVEKR